MKRGASKRRIHRVRWRTPLGPSVSPYINRLPAVRRFWYARLQAALDLTEIDHEARVLDFGCWDGHFLPSLAKHFGEVWGVDDDSSSCLETVPGCWTTLQIARRLSESEIGPFQQLVLTKASAPALPFRSQCFDVVFCLDTLVHVPQQLRSDVISELRRVTKSNGQVIFSLPIENGLSSLLRHTTRRLTAKVTDPNTNAYNYRFDLELIRTSFSVLKEQFFPVNALGIRNPILLLDCRIQARNL
jgi:ubiquinone/menaquinone biosynthesis C-methylase UbiE